MSDRAVGQAPLKLMIWCAAKGGMRSVVEAYRRDGFLEAENVRLIASYVDGGFVRRQGVLIGALVQFLWQLATRPVALVHCHAAMRGSFWRKGLFSSIARLFGIPVVLHLHGSEMKPFYRAQPAILQALIRRQLEGATRVLVLSESWRAFIAEIAPRARIEVVPNYVTLPPLPAPGVRRDRDALFLGLIGTRKGVFDLLPAFARVVRAHPDAKLTIGGNGEVERAAQMIASLDLGRNVALPGWVDGPAKEKLLQEAGIYVLPSHNEGLPMSVLEAMAMGMAVVTTRVGGIPELVTDGQDGLLIDAGDQEALAAALSKLIDDAALRERLMTAARARIEAAYSDAVVLPMLHAIYAQCLAEGARSRSPLSGPSQPAKDHQP